MIDILIVTACAILAPAGCPQGSGYTPRDRPKGPPPSPPHGGSAIGRGGKRK